VAWTAALFAVAVLVGRAVPDQTDAHGLTSTYPATPRYAAINELWYTDHPETPRLLDLETGSIVRCTQREAEGLDQSSCSPWRDARGQYHLLGRWKDPEGKRYDRYPETIGLARFTFPEGRLLDRVSLDRLPVGSPCWFPDGSQRALLLSGDNELYIHDFSRPGNEGRGEGAGRLRRLRFQGGETGLDRYGRKDLCWPGDPALAGRILLVLDTPVNSAPVGGASRLWWLELNREATEVVPRGTVVPIEGPGPAPRRYERLPSVGISADGSRWLAYLARRQFGARWELWLLPLELGSSDQPPRPDRSAARCLVDGCAPMAPSFSTDGRWLYAWLLEGNRIRLRRFPVGRESGAASPRPLDASRPPLPDRSPSQRQALEAQPGGTPRRSRDRLALKGEREAGSRVGSRSGRPAVLRRRARG
jgi:hypothetical protein